MTNTEKLQLTLHASGLKNVAGAFKVRARFKVKIGSLDALDWLFWLSTAVLSASCVSSNSTSCLFAYIYITTIIIIQLSSQGTSDPFAIVTLLASDPGEKPRVLGKTEGETI